MFFKDSRYEKTTTRSYTASDGRVIKYKAIRLLPRPRSFVAHVVDEIERPDHVAYQHYRAPERFWHIADANIVVDARDLTEARGRPIDIPPAGA